MEQMKIIIKINHQIRNKPTNFIGVISIIHKFYEY